MFVDFGKEKKKKYVKLSVLWERLEALGLGPKLIHVLFCCHHFSDQREAMWLSTIRQESYVAENNNDDTFLEEILGLQRSLKVERRVLFTGACDAFSESL